MSAIDNNALPGGFPALPAAEFWKAGGGAPTAAQVRRSNDSIVPAFVARTEPPFATPDPTAASGNPADGSSGFGNLMSSVIDALQNLLAGLARQFGSSNGSTSGTAPEQYFANATSSSVGDPHEAFAGTSGTGRAVTQKWDDMQSHPDLLDSGSVAGGYRVSTTATAPNSKGVTLNGSANVALAGGTTNISMNGDGSYSVSENGQNVALEQDRAVSLGNGESVTLGADKSLTVSAQSGAGGSLSTTLSTNDAGGVDVKNSAADVSLGGYLVTRTDSPNYPLPGPSRYEPEAQAPAAAGFETEAALRNWETMLA